MKTIPPPFLPHHRTPSSVTETYPVPTEGTTASMGGFLSQDLSAFPLLRNMSPIPSRATIHSHAIVLPRPRHRMPGPPAALHDPPRRTGAGSKDNPSHQSGQGEREGGGGNVDPWKERDGE